jgi:predicted nucleic acid-binding Zn ribbon protein
MGTGEERRHEGRGEITMWLVVVLLILALLLGGLGLFVEALRWVLIIALILLVVSIVTGFLGRRR